MKRGDVIRHDGDAGCVLKREGANHTIYVNPGNNRRTAISRQGEIDRLVRDICRQLGIDPPGRP